MDDVLTPASARAAIRDGVDALAPPPSEHEQSAQLGEVGAGQVPELSPVEFQNGAIDAGEQIEPLAGDADDHEAAILFGASALGEPRVDQTIDQPRDIGNLCDKLLADGLAGDAVGPVIGPVLTEALCVATEDAEGVVLGLGQPIAAEEAGGLGGEDGAGAHEVEEGLFFGDVEGLLFADLVLEIGGPGDGFGSSACGHEWADCC